MESESMTPPPGFVGPTKFGLIDIKLLSRSRQIRWLIWKT
jgi:hypothetical protein